MLCTGTGEDNCRFLSTNAFKNTFSRARDSEAGPGPNSSLVCEYSNNEGFWIGGVLLRMKIAFERSILNGVVWTFAGGWCWAGHSWVVVFRIFFVFVKFVWKRSESSGIWWMNSFWYHQKFLCCREKVNIYKLITETIIFQTV